MRYIKQFENFGEQTEQDIHKICEYYSITDYSINSDMSIDVYGDVRLRDKKLKELPLQFNNVEGYFSCNENKLTSLKGCPKYVSGFFSCQYNNITSLQYIPKEVDGILFIINNPLPSEILDLDGFDLKILIKHQEEYGIWDSDGSFNKARFDIFIKDYEGGILNND